jgi:hypothetical protein
MQASHDGGIEENMIPLVEGNMLVTLRLQSSYGIF